MRDQVKKLVGDKRTNGLNGQFGFAQQRKYRRFKSGIICFDQDDQVLTGERDATQVNPERCNCIMALSNHLTITYAWFLAKWAKRLSWKECADAFEAS